MSEKPTLNQIIAVVSGKKSKAESLLTAVHHGLDAGAITGLSRVYRPVEDDGEQLQPEGCRVQVLVFEALREVCSELGRYYDVVATQEWGNRTASADVVVDGDIVLTTVPVTVLLFLEKRLQDLRTFIGKLPTLPKDRQWGWNSNTNCFASEQEETRRTKKVDVPVVLYEATNEHPAQVQLVKDDRLLGYWTKTDFSGAIPAQQGSEMLRRCEKLLEAVKVAREAANSIEVEQRNIGESVLDFVFGELRAPQA